MTLHPDQLSLLDVPPEETPAQQPEPARRQRTTGRARRSRSDGMRQQRSVSANQATSMPAAAVALLTTEEAASVLRVHPRTVQRLVERGQLCAVHIGCAVRFDPQDVAGLVERVKSAPSAPTAPGVAARVRARGRGTTSFAERLRSRQHEHRPAHA